MPRNENIHLKAVKRQHKKRPKMAVHGSGVKRLPAQGILKRKRLFP